MNRKAKRNKYRNTLACKNVEINTLKNEVRGYTNAYYNALSDFRKCSRKLEEQEEKTEEYKKKYFDQLKKELIDIKCEIEDYFHKKGDCDGSIWTEQGIINYIYETISQLIKD